MSTFLERIEAPLGHIAGKLGRQPHLNAIRDGVVGALPLVIIGSIFMIIAQPPLPSQEAMNTYMGYPFVGKLLIAFRLLVGLISLYVAFGVAHGLARRYDLDALSAGLLSVAGLLMTNGMQVATAVGTETAGRFLPTINLGSGGLFMAIIIGLLVPEVQRFAKKHHLEIAMPAGVPPAVGRSFSALIPGLFILVPLWAVVHLFDINLFAVVNQVLTQPVLALSSEGHSVFIILLAIILIDSILWLLGVHAVAILAPMAAVWLMNITANGEAVALGQAATALNTREGLQFYIWLGGSGATIALPFLLLCARAASLRAIAKVGAVPALFNINEPLIFGVPVMMNLTLAIPFIVAPIVTLTTTVLATQLGLVPVPHMVVPWTLPAPVGAFLATGGAWSAAVLSTVNIALAALIYWPFVRAYDRKMAELEAAAKPVAEPAKIPVS